MPGRSPETAGTPAHGRSSDVATEVRLPPVLSEDSLLQDSLLDAVASPVGPGSGLADGPAEVRAAALVAEMADAWRRGERPRVEDYLAREPWLRDQPESLIGLIAEEIRLRREQGDEAPTVEFVRRFPECEEALAGCNDLMSFAPRVAAARSSRLPSAGESLGEFRLLSVLGRGALGSVFLAVQPSLADRPLVLKVTPRKGHEHLSLARLQHAHIVPLYWVQDLAERDLRVLCMPYLGGSTLARLLNMMAEVPPGGRSGKGLLEALDLVQAEVPVAVPAQGPARPFLAHASYSQAICWIGACLADALHFAHQRELLHLDLKPSNILLAADGTPMLLDFHLAQAPIRPDEPGRRRLGGTPAYMSPEQWSAMMESRGGRAVAIEVDGRSDVYSLGLMLYEALGGKVPAWNLVPRPIEVRRPPSVPTGLADILAKCLEYDPARRYADAALLAEDLRRHLSDLPLRGVANRSLRERWRKWRRRQPYALGRALTSALTAAALVVAGLVVVGDGRQRIRRAETALAEGRAYLEAGKSADAAQALGRGLALTQSSQVEAAARFLPRVGALRKDLGEQLRRARQAQTAEELHGLVDRIRLLYGTDALEAEGLRALERRLEATWQARGRIMAQVVEGLGPEAARRLKTDLLELGISLADLRHRLADGAAIEARRRDALRTLEEAEALFGASAVLENERGAYAGSPGQAGESAAAGAARRLVALAPTSAWEHYALGRSLLGGGALEAAARELDAAVEANPQDLWGQFYRGICAYRLRRFADAVAAFDVCVALAPTIGECYYNRARAEAALGRTQAALRDYGHALRLAPGLAIAALNRGVLHYRAGRYLEAIDDFRRALAGGANPAAVHYNRALAHLARGDRASARADLEDALRHDPDRAECRDLALRLRREDEGRTGSGGPRSRGPRPAHPPLPGTGR